MYIGHTKYGKAYRANRDEWNKIASTNVKTQLVVTFVPITAIAETPGSSMRNHVGAFSRAVWLARRNCCRHRKRSAFGRAWIRRAPWRHCSRDVGEMSASVGTAKRTANNYDYYRMFYRPTLSINTRSNVMYVITLRDWMYQDWITHLYV